MMAQNQIFTEALIWSQELLDNKHSSSSLFGLFRQPPTYVCPLPFCLHMFVTDSLCHALHAFEYNFCNNILWGNNVY